MGVTLKKCFFTNLLFTFLNVYLLPLSISRKKNTYKYFLLKYLFCSVFSICCYSGNKNRYIIYISFNCLPITMWYRLYRIGSSFTFCVLKCHLFSHLSSRYCPRPCFGLTGDTRTAGTVIRTNYLRTIRKASHY